MIFGWTCAKCGERMRRCHVNCWHCGRERRTVWREAWMALRWMFKEKWTPKAQPSYANLPRESSSTAACPNVGSWRGLQQRLEALRFSQDQQLDQLRGMQDSIGSQMAQARQQAQMGMMQNDLNARMHQQSGGFLYGFGTDPPKQGLSGFAPGAMFKTDLGLYQNRGNNGSALWEALLDDLNLSAMMGMRR